MKKKNSSLKDTIKSLKIRVLEDNFVFVTVDFDFQNFLELEPLGTFIENEGLSLIIKQNIAQNYDLKYETVLNCIVVDIATSLEMVGLSAYISAKLANENISANIVTANFHDYIFVPKKDIDRAISVLR